MLRGLGVSLLKPVISELCVGVGFPLWSGLAAARSPFLGATPSRGPRLVSLLVGLWRLAPCVSQDGGLLPSGRAGDLLSVSGAPVSGGRVPAGTEDTGGGCVACLEAAVPVASRKGGHLCQKPSTPAP